MRSVRFTRKALPLGDEEVTVLVGEDNGRPTSVFMSYESFLEVVATLYTAIEVLKASGIELEDADERLPLRPAG